MPNKDVDVEKTYTQKEYDEVCEKVNILSDENKKLAKAFNKLLAQYNDLHISLLLLEAEKEETK